MTRHFSHLYLFICTQPVHIRLKNVESFSFLLEVKLGNYANYKHGHVFITFKNLSISTDSAPLKKEDKHMSDIWSTTIV